MLVTQRSEIIPANGVLILDQANTIYLLASSASITLTMQQQGSNEVFANAQAGLKIKRVKQWSQATIVGTPGATAQFFYGLGTYRDDDTTFDIATVTGSIPTTTGPGSTTAPTDHADVVVATGVTSTAIGVNGSRKYVTIGSLSSNAPATLNLRVRGHGDVVGGFELQPGTWASFPTQAALDVFNGDANGQTYWWQEQT